MLEELSPFANAIIVGKAAAMVTVSNPTDAIIAIIAITL
jgi:hypothetical protein